MVVAVAMIASHTRPLQMREGLHQANIAVASANAVPHIGFEVVQVAVSRIGFKVAQGAVSLMSTTASDAAVST